MRSRPQDWRQSLQELVQAHWLQAEVQLAREQKERVLVPALEQPTTEERRLEELLVPALEQPTTEERRLEELLMSAAQPRQMAR